MKTKSFLIVLLSLSTLSSLCQDYVQLGKRKYPITFAFGKYYAGQEKHKVYGKYYAGQEKHKVYKVPSYYTPSTFGLVDPSPPYTTISITDSVALRSTIIVDFLTDSITIPRDSLINLHFNLVIKNKILKIQGCKAWAIGDRTYQLEAITWDDYLHLLRSISSPSPYLKNIHKLIFTDLYYKTDDTPETHTIGFEFECNLIP